MSTIRFANTDPNAAASIRSDPALDNDVMKVYFAGSPDELQLFEIHVKPDEVIEPHGHRQDEIIYVAEGTLRFGGRVCPAGTAIMIPKYTQYSFRGGPEGARYLNFRPARDAGMLTPDELRETRRQHS